MNNRKTKGAKKKKKKKKISPESGRKILNMRYCIFALISRFTMNFLKMLTKELLTKFRQE